jgi:hypothetical protein
MKYNPSSDYVFECHVAVNGIHAESVESKLKNALKEIIKESSPDHVNLSNECIDKKDRTGKLFSVIEDIHSLVDGKIIHIGRIPEHWKPSLKEEMEKKEELDPNRLLFLDDCIIVYVEKDELCSAVILNRKGIFSISSNPPK